MKYIFLFLLAVDIILRILQKLSPPSFFRKQPDIFNLGPVKK